MSDEKLAYTVWVDGEKYGPDSTDIPAQVAEQIGEHAWIDGKKPANRSRGGKIQRAEQGGTGDGPPPLSGKGSGEDAWRAYAETVEVDVTDAKTRDEIIDAIKAAGKPVEPAGN